MAKRQAKVSNRGQTGKRLASLVMAGLVGWHQRLPQVKEPLRPLWFNKICSQHAKHVPTVACRRISDVAMRLHSVAHPSHMLSCHGHPHPAHNCPQVTSLRRTLNHRKEHSVVVNQICHVAVVELVCERAQSEDSRKSFTRGSGHPFGAGTAGRSLVAPRPWSKCSGRLSTKALRGSCCCLLRLSTAPFPACPCQRPCARSLA